MSLKEKERLEKAFKVFKEAVETVPAYRDFLEKNGVAPPSIRGPEDFSNLPLTDKDGYLRNYPLPMLCLNGSLKGMHAVYRSAGTTGEPMYWPRLPEEESGLPDLVSREFKTMYGIGRLHTLVVVALPLGSWLRGGEVTWAAHASALGSGGLFGCVTPGDDVDEAVRAISKLGKYYDQVLLVCHPPRLLAILEKGEELGLDWKELKMRLAFVGESVSEEWRSKLGARMGLSEAELLGTWGSYGGTETGRVGRETPFTVLLRRKAAQDTSLCNDLFGQDAPPFLCERDPAAAQVEVLDGELVFTKRQAVPLVRYNIHDKGAIVSRHRILDVCREHGIDLADELVRLGFKEYATMSDAPVLAVYGRSTGAVRFMGVELHPDHVVEALKMSSLKGSCTQKVKLKLSSGYKGEQRLKVFVELADGVVPDQDLARKFSRTIGKNLKTVNPAFGRLCTGMEKDSKECIPDVTLIFFGNWDEEVGMDG